MPFPTDKPSEIDSEVPLRRPRRKRRRRRKRPRTSTYTYDGDLTQPLRYQEPQEANYSDGYVRRRPMKRRRRPMYRRPIINDNSEEENILPRRKLIRRPNGYYANKTRNEDVKQWEPITTTEETKWKPVKPTTAETTSTVSTTSTSTTTVTIPSIAITVTPKMSTVVTSFSTQKFTDENNKINHREVGTTKKSNSSRADMVVLHKRPINSNLPPTSAIIRRRIKPKNATSTSSTAFKSATFKPKMIVIQEELPLSLLPPGFIKTAEDTPAKVPTDNTDDYRFNDRSPTEITKEQESNYKNNDFKSTMAVDSPAIQPINNTNDYRFNDEALTRITKEQSNRENDDLKYKSAVDSSAKESTNNTEDYRSNDESLPMEIVNEHQSNRKNKDYVFKPAGNAPTKESMNNTEDYRFNDEVLTKIMNEQSSHKNNDFKFKSDSIPKVKDEILSLLKTKTGSLLLSNILNLRNMSLEELLQHRERGSSQRHQELIDAKEEQLEEEVNSGEPIIVTENTKNFTNYLIETKRLAQSTKDTQKPEKLNNIILFTENSKELTTQTTQTSMTSKNSNEEKQEVNRPTEQIPKLKQDKCIDEKKSKEPIQVSQEENHSYEDTSVFNSPTIVEPLNNVNMEKDEHEEEDLFKIKLDSIFEEKKVFSFPTTTTYTTANENNKEHEATSFVSKTPKTRIVLETPEREPRLFDSMPDFTLKTTSRPLVTPTIPSQVLFIQDTNHLDKYQSYEEKNKDIDEDNNLIYRRFEMRKLPVAVKSAIIASAAILAIAVLGFFILLISCRMRQRKRILRKKSPSVFCQHNIHHDPDLRSSARSTSPVMDKHCHDQYYDGYGGHIDAQSTANRQYYLWRTLRKTFRYD